MNSVFFSPKCENQGRQVYDLVKTNFPGETARIFRTIVGLKRYLKRFNCTAVAVVFVGDEDELLELALPPRLPHGVALIVVLPDRQEEPLRLATSLGPALIWFADNPVQELIQIMDRIKKEQLIQREEYEPVELSWADDFPLVSNFFWYSMKNYSRRIQSLPEIAYYA
jgi:hypothetical protein